MIELVDVVKKYISKKGVEVTALNGVSITLPSRGMVFITGKSGCGKTTLLNVLGGLDEPTSGKIKIYNKTSDTFKESDFDSYRNSSVGFIFQEYNVLDEFSVKDNVAFALELQNKKVDSDRVDEILKKVELLDYKDRKPNELSGGQKQRIAIARALIKDPEIILADEPTGALDSETGKQILDLLKELSKEKLIVVVSHDIDFASQYADRIITMKDGKVIDDTLNGTDIKINREEEIKSFTLDCSKHDELVEKVSSFLNYSSGNITINQEGNTLTIIRDEAKNTLKEVNALSYEDEGKEVSFVKSKLPLRYALKIGLSNIKKKPIRFALTILLTSISLLLFGVLSTMMMFSEENVTVDALVKSNFEGVRVQKDYLQHQEDGLTGRAGTDFNLQEVDEFKEKTDLEIYPVLRFNNMAIDGDTFFNELYYAKEYDGFIPLDESSFNSLADKDSKFLQGGVIGTYPSNPSEIAISYYMYETYQHMGRVFDYTSQTDKVINSPSDLLKTEIRCFSVDNYQMSVKSTYKITAIIDLGPIDSKYDKFKETLKQWSNNEVEMFYDYLSNSLQKKAFVCQDFINSFDRGDLYVDSSSSTDSFSGIDNDQNYSLKLGDQTFSSTITCANPFSTNNYYDAIFFDDRDQEKLEDYEILIPNSLFQSICYDYILPQIDGKASESEFKDGINLYLNSYGDYSNIKEITEKLNAGFSEFCSYTISFDDVDKPVKIVGIYYDSSDRRNYNDRILCSDHIYRKLYSMASTNLYTTSYVKGDGDIYNYLIAVMPKNRQNIRRLITLLNIENKDDTLYKPANKYYEEISFMTYFVHDLLSTILIIVGVVLALFALALMTYFISLSINNKIHEIGVIRALGGNKRDVFKIFIIESLLIAVVCFILSSILSAVICSVVSNYLISQGILNVSLFIFSIPQALIILAICLVVSTVATGIPLLRLGKKHPVDILRKSN